MAQKRAIEEATAFKIVKRSFEQTFASDRSGLNEETARDSGHEPDFGARREVNRCSGCRRKVGLMGFRCRCGDLFCSEHRYSDRHDCDFDYKAEGRAAIARENPVIRPAKILKV